MAAKYRVQLTLINQILGQGKQQVAVLDKSKGLAWRVFELGPLEKSPPFLYTPLDVNISDTYGNYILIQPTKPGDQFQIADSPSGYVLQPLEELLPDGKIEVTNRLRRETMSVHFFRNEILFAEQFGLAPGQKATFEFGNELAVGVLNGIVEGQMLDDELLSQINAEFSMVGIRSADLVLRGKEDQIEVVMENIVPV